MRLIKSAWKLVREFRQAYIVLNLVYYAMVVLGMVFVAFNPRLQQSLLETVGTAFTQEPLSTVADAYIGGKLFTAIVLTFVVNLVLASIMWITIPSLLIPFSGLLAGLLRAALWGLVLSPTTPEMAKMMIPHSLTLVIEGQAYVVAMLAVYVHGKAFIAPRTVGAATYTDGYSIGLERTCRLYVFVVILLAVAAVYEALEGIFIVPVLLGR